MLLYLILVGWIKALLSSFIFKIQAIACVYSILSYHWPKFMQPFIVCWNKHNWSRSPQLFYCICNALGIYQRCKNFCSYPSFYSFGIGDYFNQVILHWNVHVFIFQDISASLCFRGQRIFLHNTSGWFGNIPLEASGDFGIHPEEGEFHLMCQVWSSICLPLFLDASAIDFSINSLYHMCNTWILSWNWKFCMLVQNFCVVDC